MQQKYALHSLYKTAFLALFFSLLSLTGWAQQIHYVKWDAAGADNGTNWTDAYTSLDAALLAASAGDEIWVAGSLSPSMATYTPTTVFNLVQDVDMFGGFFGLPGDEGDFEQRDPNTYTTHLVGGGTEGVMEGQNITVETEINGFIIENGNSSSNGGGLWSDNCTLLIVNCTFQNNTASNNGGGLAVTGSGTSTVTLAGCEFISNTTLANEGGGVFVGSGEALRMRNCFFGQNLAQEGGGGLAANGATITAYRCGFRNNRMNNLSGISGGAGMLLNSCSVQLANLNFEAQRQDLMGTNVYGAGLYAIGTTGVLVNSRFYDNNAGPGPSGNNGGGASLNGSTLQIVNCSFGNNTGGDNGGGGLHVLSGTATVDNCVFEGNFGGSGTVETDQVFGSVTMSNSVVEGYTGGVNSDVDPAGDMLSPLGGNFSLNCNAAARGYGNSGALPADVWDMDRDGDTAEPIPYDFNGNERVQGTLNAGAYEDEIVVLVDQSASGAGTGATWADAYTELRDAMNAVGGTVTCPVQYWVAAGTYLPSPCSACGPPDRFTSFVLDNNEEIFGGFAGGELYLDGADPATNQTILSGDIGLAGNADNSYHVINANSLTDNSATLSGVIVENGNANGAAPDDSGAGLICDNFSTSNNGPVIESCIFRNNNATAEGGAIYFAYDVRSIISDTDFSNNTGSDGGAIGMQFDCQIDLDHCLFNTNTANGGSASGGAIFSGGFSTTSGVDAYECTFESNTSNTAGGALTFNADGTYYLENCMFSNNSANFGGVITPQGQSPTFVNCLFEGNSATSGNGGVEWHTSGGTSTYTNCTFYDNSATGNGANIYVMAGSIVDLENSILWQFTGGSNIENGGGTINAVNSIVEGGNTWGGVFTNSLDQDPLLVNPTGGDFSLDVCSPAIDAGDNALYTATGAGAEDLGDEPRAVDSDGGGAIVDMGAFEFQDTRSPLAFSNSFPFYETANTQPGLTDQAITRLEVQVTGGPDCQVDISEIIFNTTVTTNPSDVTTARVYYTGTSPTFTPSTQYGTDIAITASNQSLTFTDLTSLTSAGSHYFWLAYDIAPGATLGNFVRGAITQFTQTSLSGTTILSGFIPPATGDERQIFIASPEIDVTGNLVSIPSGDVTPNATDFTDFGVHNFCTPTTVASVFTIDNTGATDLILTNASPNFVEISGSPDFSITAQPTGNTIAAGASMTFEVTYSASLPGVQYATITIPNDDTDEPLYNFVVKADGGSFTGAADWIPVPVGGAGINTTGTSPHYDQDLAFAPSGEAYVAFRDGNSGDKLSAMRYDNATSSWVTVGGPGFSSGIAAEPSLKIQPSSGEAYVAYRDASLTQKAAVKRFDGTSWQDVGSAIGVTGGSANSLSMAFHPGTSDPYISFIDGANGNGITVMRFNGASWVVVGTTNFTGSTVGSTGIAFHPVSHEPYVVFSDNSISGQARVMRFDGASWVNVGVPPSAGLATETKIAFHPGTHEPYVAYKDNANGDLATLMYFDGSLWASVGGSPGVSTGVVDYLNFAFHPFTHEPYIAYQDETNGNRMRAMRFNGASWLEVTGATVMPGNTFHNTLAFHPHTGEPHVSYQDNTLGGSRTTVSRFGPPKEPEMDVLGLGVSIAHNDLIPDPADDTDFGTTPVGTPVIHTFTIENQGASDLIFPAISATLGGANPGEFTVLTQPSSPVAPCGSTTMVVQYNASTAGTHTATVSIANNDSDENPYVFTIGGQTTLPVAQHFYVKQGATGLGGSWGDPCDLNFALQTANAGDSIWVADGTYLPVFDASFNNPLDPRNVTFTLKDGVKLRGGFPNTATAADDGDFSLYDPVTNITTFSGDIGVALANGDNTYHVVTIPAGAAVDTELHGVTIQDGFSNAVGIGYGAGMLLLDASPLIADCVFQNNIASEQGGAAYIQASVATPLFLNVTFLNNLSELSDGGAVAILQTPDVDFVDCLFDNNTSTGANGGGGIYIDAAANVSIENSDFIANSAEFGGAVANGAGGTGGGATLELYDCIFESNSANAEGGAVYLVNTAYEIEFCDFIANNSPTGLGGAIALNGGFGDADHSLFVGNEAPQGGAVYIGSTAGGVTANFDFCTFTENTDNGNNTEVFEITDGGSSISANIRYSILWGNGTTDPITVNTATVGVTNCIVEGGLVSSPPFVTATNALDQDPVFANPAIGDFGLKPCSPAVDREANNAPPLPQDVDDLDDDGNTTEALPEDLEGAPRNYDVAGVDNGGTVDWGAFENQLDPVTGIIYVDANVSGGLNDGSSWANAFSDLQTALDASCPGALVAVAQGTYYPSLEVDLDGLGGFDARERTFYIPDNITVLGSFDVALNPDPANPADVAARDFAANPSILSGDFNNDDNYTVTTVPTTSITTSGTTENAYHVVTTEYVNNLTVDGFRITGGNADGTNYPHDLGGGWYNNGQSDPIGSPLSLRNLSFYQNRADVGGAYGADAESGNVSSTFTKCNFSENVAFANGGGAVVVVAFDGQGDDVFWNCSFVRNTSPGGGAAFYMTGNTGGTSPDFYNCLFLGNSATADGGAISFIITGGSAVIQGEIVNCTFTENSATGNGGAIYSNAGALPNLTPKFTNSIFWNNTASVGESWFNDNGAAPIAQNTLVQEISFHSGTIDNGGNIFATAPQFLAPAANDYSLAVCSPAVDAGEDASLPQDDEDLDKDGITAEPLPIDFDNNPRQFDALGLGLSLVDMGAFESQVPPASGVLYVDLSATAGANNGTSWADAFTDLETALASACSPGTQIWVAAGTYTPNTQAGIFLPDGVELYGGFNGTETLLTQRDWTANLTVLSGDIDGDGTLAGGNAYHILFAQAITSARVDGFTLTLGNANAGSSPDNDGAAMLLQNVAAMEVFNCIFTENEATDDGGAILSIDTQLFVENCEFTNNTAGGLGGAIYQPNSGASGHVHLMSSRFETNTANGLGGGAVAVGDSSTLRSVTFLGNNATNGSGGAFYSEVLYADLSDCLFDFNYAGNATGQGGGAFLTNGGRLINCKFINNTSEGNGGGLASSSGAGLPGVYQENCLYHGNLAFGTSGGGMWTLNSTDSLVHCTFSNNTADALNLGSGFGGSVAVDAGSSLFFFNSIAWGNATGTTTAGANTEVFTDPMGTSTFANSIIEDYAGGVASVISDDPLFVNPASNDYSLQATSPAAEHGDAAYTSTGTDLAGSVRIFNALPDAGAYEIDQPLCQALSNVGLYAPALMQCTADSVELMVQGYFELDSGLNGQTVNYTLRWGDAPGVYSDTASGTMTITQGITSWDTLLTMPNQPTYFQFVAFDTCGNVRLFSTEEAYLAPDYGDNLVGGDQIIKRDSTFTTLSDIGLPAPDTTNLIFSWEMSLDSINWQPAFANSASLGGFALDTTTYFRRLVESSLGGCGDTSNIVTVEVLQPGICTADSLILVEIYNATDGPNWTNSWNLNSPFVVWDASGNPQFNWFGVTGWGCAVESLELPNNNLSGALPASAANLGAGVATQSVFVDISENKLDFESAQPFIGAFGPFFYDNQAKINAFIDTTRNEGENITLRVSTWDVGDNTYQWYKDGALLMGETDSLLQLDSLLPSDAGLYFAQVENTIATDLTLQRRDILLNVVPWTSPSDSMFLVDLYNATGGPTTWVTPWDLTEPVATWPGLTFESGYLTEIDLSSNGLIGQLPDGFLADTIPLLDSLRYLSLFDNQLSGPLPESYGGITTLEYLDLGKNQFAGPVPASYGNLVRLNTLNLSYNQLTSLPPELGNLINLESFLVHVNQIPSIPATLQSLQSLVNWNLADNEISDFNNVFTTLPSLERLWLDGNLLAQLPPNIGNLTTLRELYARRNQLAALPASLQSLAQLEVLELGKNRLDFGDLEPIRTLASRSFQYSPQAEIGAPETFYVEAGQTFSFGFSTPGQFNRYAWTRNNAPLVSATAAQIEFTPVRSGDAGVYVPYITNTQLPDLTLRHAEFTLEVGCQALSGLGITTDDPTVFCADQAIRTRFSGPLDSNYGYQWFKGTEPIFLQNDARFTATDTGTYFLRIILPDGCTYFTDTLTVERLPEKDVPIAEVSPQVLRYQGTENFVAYQWQRDGENIPNANSAEYTARRSGTYVLQAQDDAGCIFYSAPVILSITALEDDDKLSKMLVLYPNPAREYLYVSCEGYAMESLTLRDVLGRSLQQHHAEDAPTQSFRLNLKDLPVGTYFLEVKTTEGTTLHRKFTRD